MEFTQCFFTKGWVARNSSIKSTTHPDGAFIAGSVAMALAGDFLMPGIETGSRRTFEYGSMPTPRDVAAATDLGGNAMVAPKDGPNTEAAAKFLTFWSPRTACGPTVRPPASCRPSRPSPRPARLQFRPDLMEPFVQQAKTLAPDQVAQVTVPQFAKLNVALRTSWKGVPGRAVVGRHHGRAGQGGERPIVTAAPAVAPGPVDGTDAYVRNRWGGPGVLGPSLGLAGAFLILPMFGSFVFSFPKISPLSGHITPRGLENYAQMLSDPTFHRAAAEHRPVHRLTVPVAWGSGWRWRC